MKVIGICGSPRDGNSEYMLRTFLKEMRDKGNQVEIILLKNENLLFCTGCQTCETTKTCRLTDNMNKIFSKMLNSDLIVFSFPIYFDYMPALMKNLIDRTNSRYEKLKNKKFVFLAVGALKDKEAKPGQKMVLDQMKDIIGIYGLKLEGYYFAEANKPGEIKNYSEQLEKIKEIARKIK